MIYSTCHSAVSLRLKDVIFAELTDKGTQAKGE
jgi:hypothetical protein